MNAIRLFGNFNMNRCAIPIFIHDFYVFIHFNDGNGVEQIAYYTLYRSGFM